jgi:putative tryptophan/tyrosine transport system substrate-binding protein
MRRRDFIALVGGVASWPFVARAQQPTMPVIGFLSGVSSGSTYLPAMVMAFRDGLKESGYVEGQNVAIEYRWAEGRFDRLPALAAELVARRVKLIVATGGASLAAKAATSSLPIVFLIGADPVNAGLVNNLARPEGNATGFTIFADTLMAKRVEVIAELVPHAKAIAVLANPDGVDAPAELREAEAAGRQAGREIIVVKANTAGGLESAFETIVQRGVGALIVAPDPVFASLKEQLGGLTVRYRLPAIYGTPDTSPADALATYGVILADAYRQLGIYAGKILKGAKPVDLPVLRASRFNLKINLKTAKTLGIDVPTSVLLRADEVIE